MYSERFAAIFVHIPKTAGQSIEQVFLDRHGLDWEARWPLLLRPNDDPARGPERLAHLYAKEYVECGHVTPAQFAQAFKFSVVRNPYDRVESEYCSRFPKGKKTLSEFADMLSGELNEFTDASRHLAPQHKFVLGADGELMVDAILRFDTLERDFRAVSLRLFGEEIPLPHRDRSEISTASQAIEGDVQRKILRHYEADFDLFRYPSAPVSVGHGS